MQARGDRLSRRRSLTRPPTGIVVETAGGQYMQHFCGADPGQCAAGRRASRSREVNKFSHLPCICRHLLAADVEAGLTPRCWQARQSGPRDDGDYRRAGTRRGRGGPDCDRSLQRHSGDCRATENPLRGETRAPQQPPSWKRGLLASAFLAAQPCTGP